MSRALAFIRAVAGVLGAVALVVLAYLFGRRSRGPIDGSSGQDGQCTSDNREVIDEARKVQSDNRETIARLNAALDRLRSAGRGGSG